MLADYLAPADTPLLTPEQERDLATRAHAGDSDARDELCLRNIGLVLSIAQRQCYRDRGIDLPDLIQDGCLGLLRAVDLYDPDRGCRFSTYAIPWIRMAVGRAIHRVGRTIRLPVHAEMLLHAARQATVEAEHRGEGLPDIARSLGWTASQRGCHASAASVVNRSADDPGETGRWLPDPRPGPADEAEADDALDRLAVLLAALPDREAAVIRRRFGLDGKGLRKLRDVGAELGISPEWARQIEGRAIEWLRDEMGGEG